MADEHRTLVTGALGCLGTWTLNVLEQGTSGPQSTRVANPRGLLIIDGAGHAFEFVTSSAAQRAPLGAQAPLLIGGIVALVAAAWGYYATQRDQALSTAPVKAE